MFNRGTDAKLDEEGKQALFNYECAKCIRELDLINNDLFVLEHFVKEDKKMGARFTIQLMKHPIVNHALPIHPLLQDTRSDVRYLLSQYYDKYNPNEQNTIQQALFNVAVNGKIGEIVEICKKQIDEINAKRL